MAKSRRAKIITTGTLKGGTGKTTFTFNLAGALAVDHRVLLVDVDPQGNLTSDVGVDVADQQRKSLRDIFANSKITSTFSSESVLKTSIMFLSRSTSVICKSSSMSFNAK